MPSPPPQITSGRMNERGESGSDKCKTPHHLRRCRCRWSVLHELLQCTRYYWVNWRGAQFDAAAVWWLYNEQHLCGRFFFVRIHRERSATDRIAPLPRVRANTRIIRAHHYTAQHKIYLNDRRAVVLLHSLFSAHFFCSPALLGHCVVSSHPFVYWIGQDEWDFFQCFFVVLSAFA